MSTIEELSATDFDLRVHSGVHYRKFSVSFSYGYMYAHVPG